MMKMGWVLGELTGGSATPNYGVPRWSGISLSTMPPIEAQVNDHRPVVTQGVVYFRDVVVWTWVFCQSSQGHWLNRAAVCNLLQCIQLPFSMLCKQEDLSVCTGHIHCWQTWVVTNSQLITHNLEGYSSSQTNYLAILYVHYVSDTVLGVGDMAMGNNVNRCMCQLCFNKVLWVFLLQ